MAKPVQSNADLKFKYNFFKVLMSNVSHAGLSQEERVSGLSGQANASVACQTNFCFFSLSKMFLLYAML